uniref:Phosphatidylinositol-glycan biosynthesis class F protein n=2 Tax=Cacopsylla melanoneura TaxID=428564 RepID=A0A8D8YD41_9HEMI
MAYSKKALAYCVCSNLYLPLFLVYLILQEKYLDFAETSQVLPYLYVLFISEALNAFHFKLAFGISQSSNKKFLQGILSKLGNVKLSELVQSTISILLSIFVFAFIAVIFGASVTSNYEQTLVFSSLLSIVTVLPACIHFNAQSAISLLASGQYSSNQNMNQQKIVLQKFYCTMLGAWLGAFVIPLDWNRDWQVWPIPCCMGALVGTGVGQLVSLFYLNDILQQTTRPGPGLIGKNAKRTR